MELNTIVELIGSFGFAAVVVAWLMYDSHKKDERMMELMVSFKDAVSSNTLALELLKADLKGERAVDLYPFDAYKREE